MSHLVVAATLEEVQPFVEYLRAKKKLVNSPVEGLVSNAGRISLLVSGIGQLATAFHLGAALSVSRFRSVINVGIAGSLSSEYPKGTTVVVREEALADLGSEDKNTYKDVFQMGLINHNNPPFKEGKLRVDEFPFCKVSLAKLPRVSSVTVNRVLGREDSIQYVRESFNPAIVNMEGAAVFYACLSLKIPCLQIRTVSDVVSLPIDRSSWDIPGSISTLNENLCAIVSELL